jgi:superfamily II DNA/RNA helicase
VHRIGRTGRAGRAGVALTLALPQDEKHVEKIEKLIGNPIPAAETPEAPETKAAPAPSPSPETAEDRPARGRRRSARSEPVPAAPEPAQVEAAQAEAAADRSPRRGRGRGRENGAGGERVVGFGDNPPAFVMRPVKVAKPMRASTPEAEESDDVAA